MRIKGSIHSVDVKNKIIGLECYKRVKFFYLQNNLMNLFKRYLYQGVWIDLDYSETKLYSKNGYEANHVNYVNSIYSKDRLSKNIFYDKIMLNKGLQDLFEDLENIMVVDFEMNMPSFSFKGAGFRTELIQAGFVIVDKTGKELYRYSNYIFPTLSDGISKRTEKFLSLSADEYYAKAITYDEFFDDFKDVIEKYNPAILVYGKNDIIVLNDSYKINEKPNITENARFINLCQIIKGFYNLRNDPGLFKLHKVYYNDDDGQLHDAFTDCKFTADVFFAFKDEVALKTMKAEMVRRVFD